ncbi:MAG: TonB-dependent receptor [Ekhidna sp.]|nr:TonB-dependent receptor [Ekhidna sp.]
MSPTLTKFLFCILCLIACNQIFGQISLESKLKLQGEYRLFQILDSLSKQINIAYSRDKLKNRLVEVKKNSTLQSILEDLKSNKLVQYHLEENQVVLSPYIKKSYSITGVLKDADTDEDIIGATIQIDGTNNGTFTNGYGYFSITLFEGVYKVKFSHVSYRSQTREIDLSKNIYLDAKLISLTTTLDEVEVSSIPNNVNITETIPSMNRIFVSQTDLEIPYLLGEVDVIQNALLQPGIKSIGEDASGIHVRGGAVDQNLSLLDEATIYNPNHFYGLISAFNPEAVNDIRILKGFIPPSYGGRGSSVIEVRQKEGNFTETRYSGGVGLVSARGLIEGPLKKGKSSFLVSGRQSLLNLSLNDFASTSVRRSRIRFQDLNFKVNTRPNNSNQLYLSGYYGRDRNSVGLNSLRRWGNSILNIRWNRIYSPQLFSNISAFVSEYNYKIENEEEPGAFVDKSKIRDLGFKAHFTYTFEISNEVNFGINSIYHNISPGSREPLGIETDTNITELGRERGLASALYGGHSFSLGQIYFNYGFRYSMLHNLGPRRVFIYENNQPTADTAIIDTLRFASGELINLFKRLEPRASLAFVINSATSVKSSYTRNAQYIHLISNTISPAPTDIWKLTGTYMPPLIADQYTLGLYKNFKNNIWEASIEGYYKAIQNNIQYKNGADLFFNENIETELLIGRSRAYGAELYIKKRKGKLKGWIAYTLSRAESRLNSNSISKFIAENHDKTHDFSTSWTFNISERVSASANFIYNTGIPVTLPSDKYVFENNLVPHFTQRNNSRLPDYHRLDLSLKINGKKFKKDGSIRKNRDYWIISVYNVYARKNAYSYFFRESETNSGVGEIIQYSIFGTAIPGITYSFKF